MSSPGKLSKPARSPRFSVVVPVKNGAHEIGACIAAIQDNTWQPHELLIVDDGSTDATAEIASQLGARVVSLPENHGPAYARNRGAELATGDVLFFTDADVALHPEALATAARAFAADPDLHAVIGSYDDAPDCDTFVGRYKNLFHHWVHQHSSSEASTFWTGCGAVRRDTFLAAGGFDESYPRPSIEDIELGFRLRADGLRIRLDKGMLATHMKAWRLGNLLYTDVFLRGVPWIALMLRDRIVPADLNLSVASKIATMFVGLLCVTLVALPVLGHPTAVLPVLGVAAASWLGARLASRRTPLRSLAAVTALVALPLGVWLAFPDPLAALPIALWAAIASTHPGLYTFFARRAGVAFAVGVLSMHVLFQLCCLVSVPLGMWTHWRERAAGHVQLTPLTSRSATTTAEIGEGAPA